MKTKVIAFFTLFSLFTTILSAQVTTSLGAVRDKTALDIGMNRRSDNGTWWTDATFKTLVAQMNPDVVRYPGGTQANYWDWSTGEFIPGTDKNWGNKETLTIPTFLNAIPARAKVIYTVNISRPTPATGITLDFANGTPDEQTLKSTVTLNKKIEDIINGIDKFAVEGKTPYAVEMGNEFYFGNGEGGIFEIKISGGKYYAGKDAVTGVGIQHNNKKDATVTNVKYYLDVCKVVVDSIKAHYPNIKVALVSTKRGNGNSVREKWNTTIYDELQNNATYATLKNQVDALTQHHYIDSNYGTQVNISDNATAKFSIAEGITYPIDRNQDYIQSPSLFDIWYTEYGETKRIAEETWASAVRFAALTMSWMNRGDKVGQLDWHYISDNNVVKTGAPMKLAPVGIAAKQLLLASADMIEMQEITFTNNPVASTNVGDSNSSVLSLYGYKFKNSTKETIFIINTNDVDITQVKFDNLFTYTGQPKITQYYSNNAALTPVDESSASIVSNIQNLPNGTTEFTANKFSITVIEVTKVGSSITSVQQGDWNATTTWVGGNIPTVTDDVVLDHKVTVKITTATCKNMTVNATGMLQVNANKAITIKGNLITEGTIKMATTSNGNTQASIIIEGNVSGSKANTIVYNNHLPTSKWHLISTPFNAQRMDTKMVGFSDTFVITDNGTPDLSDDKTALATYDDSQPVGSKWQYYTHPMPPGNNAKTTPGKGYTAKLTGAQKLNFKGGFNTTDITIPIAANQYNLIGNPFTASIHGNDASDVTHNFIRLNQSKLVEYTLWYWNPAANSGAGTYQPYLLGDPTALHIHPIQGFFVKANGVGGNFTFTEAMQHHHTQADVYTRTTNDIFEIKLKMNSDNEEKTTLVRYQPNATTSFDNGYDGSVFGGTSYSYLIYTGVVANDDDRKLAIQSLPDSNYENMIIPVGVISESGKTLVFSVEITNLPDTYKVFLEDRSTSTFTRIDEGNTNYTVTLSEELNNIGRFYLHVTTETLKISNTFLSSIKVIYTKNNTVKMVGLPSGNTRLSLYTVLGKTLLQTSFNTDETREVMLPKLQTGVYIIRLKTFKGEIHKKIVVK